MSTGMRIDPDRFLDYISEIDKSSISSDLDRRRVVLGLQALLAKLQSPREKTTQLLHTNSYLVAAVKSLVNLDLFGAWERDGGQPQTVEDLAQLTGADPALLARLLRLLLSSGMLSTGEDERYIFGEFAKGLTAGRLSHSWQLHSFTTANSVVALPKYLQEKGYASPTSSKDSPWAHYMGVSFIDYLTANPQIFTHINEVMKTKNMDTLPWFTAYPIDTLIDDYDPASPFFVDIGGGTGYDVKTLLEHLSRDWARGSFILQDLPQVVDEAMDLSSAIVKQAYDFFTEQPIKGARVYYMHNVLHDWSDGDCLKILARIRLAMKPGYSRLLINETVISSSSAPTACATDLSMMTVNAGAERTDTQWHDLLADAEFSASEIYYSAIADENIIEARF